jgi:hypothetical protein
MTLEIIALAIPTIIIYTTGILVGLRMSDRWLARHMGNCLECQRWEGTAYGSFYCDAYDDQLVMRGIGSAFWPIALLWLGVIRPIGRLLARAANAIANLVYRPKPLAAPSRIRELEQELGIGEEWR